MLIPVATVALCVCATSSAAAAAPFLAFAKEPEPLWNPRDAPKCFTSDESADAVDADVDACAPNARRASAVDIASVDATTGDRRGRFLRDPAGARDVTARERDRECPRLGAMDARDGSEPGRFSSRDEVAGARRRRRAKGAAMARRRKTS
jgi:hypothetical protein